VGILFAHRSGGPPKPNVDYFNGRIAECTFDRGWRGVALDDRPETEGGTGVPITLWGSEIASCRFTELSGSAVRLVNAPGLYFGMPSNALRDLFVQNWQRENVEPQVAVETQGGA
jgi:hypothetical protein